MKEVGVLYCHAVGQSTAGVGQVDAQCFGVFSQALALLQLCMAHQAGGT